MSIAERRSTTRPSAKIPAPSENVMLVIVALAFLMFHIAVAVTIHGALPNEPVAQLEQAIASYGD
jgi:hypothetical protein